MALPSSGAISIADVAAELNISSSGLSLDDSRVRSLAGISSGAISLSNLHGKSNGGTLVAGQISDSVMWYAYGYSVNGSGISSNRAMGSLSALPGAPAMPLFIGVVYEEGNPQIQIEFSGNVVSSMSGKTLKVNNVSYPLGTPSVSGGKTYIFANGEPFANGGTYVVSIS